MLLGSCVPLKPHVASIRNHRSAELTGILEDHLLISIGWERIKHATLEDIKSPLGRRVQISLDRLFELFVISSLSYFANFFFMVDIVSYWLLSFYSALLLILRPLSCLFPASTSSEKINQISTVLPFHYFFCLNSLILLQSPGFWFVYFFLEIGLNYCFVWGSISVKYSKLVASMDTRDALTL